MKPLPRNTLSDGAMPTLRALALSSVVLSTGCQAATDHDVRTDLNQGGSTSEVDQGGTGGNAGAMHAPGGSGGTSNVTFGGSAGSASAGSGGMGGGNIDEPAPPPEWVNATGDLAGMASGCVSVGRVASQPGSKRIIAGVGLKGLFASDDSGQTWQPLGTGEGSASITNDPSSISFDPIQPNVFWETGIHDGGGLFRTDDGGETFVQLGSITFTQDLAVDFSDPARSTLLTGTHGVGVYRSTDGGESFVDVGTSLPNYPFWPLLIDAETHLIATFDGGNAASNAIRRTSDGGTTWTQVSDLPPSHDGGFVRATGGSIYLPLAGNNGFAKSTDLGLTWSALTPGVSFGSPAFSTTPLELPGGELVTIGADHLLSSSDGGSSFQLIGEPLPFEISPAYSGGLSYSVATKTFFIWHSTCGANVVLDDGIMSAGYEYVK